LIKGLRTGKPNYDEMGPGLAEASRQLLSYLHPDIHEAGPIQSIRFVGAGNGCADVYFVQRESRPLSWRIGLDSDGMISMAWVSRGL
jgi:hypothetical protein